MRHIPVAEIDRLPQPLGFFREKSVPTSEAAARELYHPPVVGSVGGALSLLWGRETLRLAGEVGLSGLWCRDLGALSALEAAKAAVAAENRPGRWDLDELVGFLEFLREREEEADEELSGLVDGPKRGVLDQARKAASLPEPVRGMVLTGTLTLRHGEELSKLPTSLLEAVAGAAEKGSFSIRREIVQMTVEVYKRHREESSEVEGLLKGALTEHNPRQALYALRYPSYSAARGELDRFRERYLKGTGLRLEEPPNFEGDSFSLIIPFSTPRELEKRLEHARRAAEEIVPITELLG